MRSTVGNGSIIIVMLTLTSLSMFLLLQKGGSGVCFSFVLASVCWVLHQCGGNGGLAGPAAGERGCV